MIIILIVWTFIINFLLCNIQKHKRSCVTIKSVFIWIFVPLPHHVLFHPYVRSKLEYCSLIWNPFYQIHADNLENVQPRSQSIKFPYNLIHINVYCPNCEGFDTFTTANFPLRNTHLSFCHPPGHNKVTSGPNIERPRKVERINDESSLANVVCTIRRKSSRTETRSTPIRQ